MSKKIIPIVSLLFIWFVSAGFWFSRTKLSLDQSHNRYQEFMPAIALEDTASFNELKREYGQGISYERAKINYLFEMMAKTTFTYDRNGMQYNGQETAEHLRKKYRLNVRNIKSARDFIDFIATKSLVSGRFYKVMPGNGFFYHSCDLLNYELERLEKEMDRLHHEGQ